MRINLIVLTIAALAALCLNAFASETYTYNLKKHHEGAGLSCADCHKTAQPAVAAEAETCTSCHADMRKNGKVVSLFEKRTQRTIEINPHAAHAGPIRCTQCHSEHKESKLLCNTGCHQHHTWTVLVP
ncbi:MAG: cytochrome c3 family protein [Deferribacterales bacterium]